MDSSQSMNIKIFASQDLNRQAGYSTVSLYIYFWECVREFIFIVDFNCVVAPTLCNLKN